MKKYILKFYLIGFLISLLVIGGVFGAFKYFDTNLIDEIERHLLSKNDFISKSIDAEIQTKAQIVNDLVYYIQSGSSLNEEELLNFTKEILANDRELFSLYFGSIHNHMINASGWIPPEDFDLRKRPWYIKAKEQKDLIFTDVFLNASKDKQIITIARPVFDKNNELLGVVGADLSLDTIINMISIQTDDLSGVFLVDSNQTIIAHSGFSGDQNIALEDVSREVSKIFETKINQIIPTVINGESGYGYLSKIEGTNLTLGIFIPKVAYSSYQNQWTYGLVGLILLIITVFYFMFRLQKKLIIEPALDLETEIKKISLVENLSYRLASKKNDPFEEIKNLINLALIQAVDYFYQLKNNQEELEASNEELNASLNQLKAYQEELEHQQQELKESNLLLEKSERRNRGIVSVMPDTIFVYSSEGDYLHCQTNNQELFIVPKEHLIGKNLMEIIPNDIGNRTLESIRETLESSELQRFEYQLMTDNCLRTFETRMVKIEENEVLAVVRDITIEKEDQERILNLTYKDQLTGLYNRRYFEEQLLKMDTPEGLPLGIIMIDINGLKLTNDAFGHFKGDELLRKVALRLNGCINGDGFVSRIGGDEFVVVCPKTDHETTEKIIGKLYQEISEEKLDNIVISISAGWEIRTSMNQSIRETMIKAENHMFRKKVVESQSMRNQTVHVIMQTLNEKNEREKRHSVEVSKWAKKIGEAMGLNAQLVKEIEIAGLLHDIGKVAIKEEILNKPGKLTDEEYDEIKRHSECGYHILKSVDEYLGLAESILQHHERFDGNGYPKGTKGDEISLIAKIIAVADSYEAMIADRPYRSGIGHEHAIDEILKYAGTQFDPQVVDAFMTLFKY